VTSKFLKRKDSFLICKKRHKGVKSAGRAIYSVGKKAYDFYDKHHKVIHAVAGIACAKCLVVNKMLSGAKTIHTGIKTAQKVVDNAKWAVGCLDAPGQCAQDFVTDKAKSWVGDKVSEFAGENLHRVGLSADNLKKLENHVGEDAFKFAKETAVSKFESARDSMISRAQDAIIPQDANNQAREEIAVVEHADSERRAALARLQATERVEKVEEAQAQAASQTEVALIIAEKAAEATPALAPVAAEETPAPAPVATDGLEVDSDADDDDDHENLYDDREDDDDHENLYDDRD
jgi:hypothetical protein